MHALHIAVDQSKMNASHVNTISSTPMARSVEGKLVSNADTVQRNL